MTPLTTIAIEQSTIVITAAFTNEDGDAVEPTAATWTLTDIDGTVINSRSAVAITAPTSSEDIVLSGDDLAIQDGETAEFVRRVLTVEATYDSSRGTGLTLKKAALFTLENLPAVS